MFTEMTKRKYEQTRRAAQQEQTRGRIVDAVMALHEEVGPRATTISAVAARAGVQRLTVYRHFPDDAALFSACTARWLEINPPPDPQAWQDVANAPDRTRRALEALYGYYRGTARMWAASHRDEGAIPALHGPMEEFRAYLRGVRDDLAGAWTGERYAPQVRTVLGHAVRFTTWQALAEDGVEDSAMADLMLRWLESVHERAELEA